MRIVGVTTFGGPERLQLLEAPEPHAGPGEVRIRVQAATINPTDVGLRQGYQGYQLPGRAEPYVPGMEAAGVISEVGPGAPFQLGTASWPSSWQPIRTAARTPTSWLRQSSPS